MKIKKFLLEGIVENASTIIMIIIKWLCFPFCFILMCLKRLRYVFTQDIPVFYRHVMYSPLVYYDGGLHLDTHDTFIGLIRQSACLQQKYLLDIIPADWSDKPELSRDILFEMVRHFVEEEKCFEFIDYDWNDDVRKTKREIIKLYNYVISPISKKEKAIEFLIKMDKNFYKKMGFLDNFEECIGKQGAKEVAIEHYLELLDTVVMVRICKLRTCLWT